MVDGTQLSPILGLLEPCAAVFDCVVVGPFVTTFTIIASVMFNERFIQCFYFLNSSLMDLFASDWLTKSSSHTSLVLTNSGLVITTLGPNNLY